MNDNGLWVLIARRLSGEISAPEEEELQGLLELHPDKQRLLEILSVYFTDPPPVTDSDIPDIYFEERFRQIIEEGNEMEKGKEHPDSPYIPEANSQPKSLRLRRLPHYAAVFIGISTVSWLVYLASPSPPPAENKTAKSSEVVTKPGARTKLVLPDGTGVWLNSGSKLNYQKEFNTRFREVELEGEAYFDVTKDAAHPFIVHTSGIDIKVLGTVFNVKSYFQDETIETTLLRGIIEVTRKDNPNGPKVILRPNEKLIFSKHLSTLSLNAGSAKPAETKQTPAKTEISVIPISKNIPDSEKTETSWVYNRLVFDGDSFQELAVKMERWYNVKITINNEELSRYRFKGSFENETIKEALDALRLTAEFSYKFNNNEINLFRK